MHATVRLLLVGAAAATAVLCSPPAVAGDPAQDLRSDDVAVRVAAVETLRTAGGADAESILLQALKDRDWEVVEAAAAALGEKGGEAAVKPLVQVALEAPARRMRVAAARSLGRLPQRSQAADLLLARTGGDLATNAYDALAAMADAADAALFEKGLDKGLDAKPETGVRGAAAALLAGLPPDVQAARLPKLLADKDPQVGCAAANAARVRAHAAFTAPLLGYLTGVRTSEVVERRVRRALVAISRAAGDESVFEAVSKSSGEASADASVRLMRLVADLIAGRERSPATTHALAILNAGGLNSDPRVRGAVAHALASVADDEAAARARRFAKEDADPRVRLLGLRSAVKLGDPSKQPLLGLLTDAVARDADPLVREEAAVALGRKGLTDGVPVLVKAAQDAMAVKDGSAWALGTCALVSLGKTEDPGAVPSLVSVLEKAKDWRLRASAVVGLGHVRQKEAIPRLIEALGAKEPVLRNVAYEFLRRYAAEPPVNQQTAWKAWWKANEASFDFRDFKAEAEKAKKYGYSPTFEGVYEGLDVIVLQSRGDHIEKLLERLSIEFRLTRSANVEGAGLHPFGVFVANCTGEITPKDVEPLQWFVRSGGYLFGSCWALHHTIEKVYPGVVRKFDIKGQVIDTVPAEPCRDASPFLEGVFPPGVTPMYVLEGAHLIDVIDADRAEVLIDSPWTEGKYGSGNLAAWFTTGHGVILDSVNHFDLQGLEGADRLKTAADRKAYAIDHLGMTWAEVRAISDATWDNGAKASKEARDLSAFRFITNFVREKRKWFE